MLIEKQPVGSEIYATFLEIYNERVFDLLSPNAETEVVLRGTASAEPSATSALDSRLHAHAGRGRPPAAAPPTSSHHVIINELVLLHASSVPVASFAAFLGVYRRACTARATAATRLNKSSSRSHAIVALSLRHHADSPSATPLGELLLVDLAGSEDNRRTGNAGKRLAESGAINRSLFTLSAVVEALLRAQRDRTSHVPFRDSKLTRLLQGSLAPSAESRASGMALVIVNVAPERRHLVETYASLNFATRSRQIVQMLREKVNQPTTADDNEQRQTAKPPEVGLDRKALLEQWKRERAAGAASLAAKATASSASSSSRVGTAYVTVVACSLDVQGIRRWLRARL